MKSVLEHNDLRQSRIPSTDRSCHYAAIPRQIERYHHRRPRCPSFLQARSYNMNLI